MAARSPIDRSRGSAQAHAALPSLRRQSRWKCGDASQYERRGGSGTIGTKYIDCVLSILFAAAIAFDAHCGDAARKVVASQPFESAAVSWTSSAQVKIRVSADGVSWSDWIAPAMDADSDRNMTAITH